MKKFISQEIKKFVSVPIFNERILLKKNPNFPKISIVTSSYNQAEFLERTILSVLNQNYPNLEYVIMDGGSTDKTVEIIKKYQKYLKYWTSEKDNGQADALEKGFKNASGEILAFLNSDDVYLPGVLKAVAKTFHRKTALDVVYGNMYIIDSYDKIIDERRQTPFFSRGYLYGGIDIFQPATFWRRNIFQNSGCIGSTYFFSFDTDLFFRFVLNKAKFYFVKKFFACFRIHSNSKTSTASNIGQINNIEIRTSYLPFPYNSFRGKIIRSVVKGWRVLGYALQGDGIWLTRKIISRISTNETLKKFF